MADISIFGTLHSVVEDQTVATTDQIRNTSETLPKMQSDLNAHFNIGEGWDSSSGQWVKISGEDYSAGNGINIDSTTISVKANSGITVGSAGVSVKAKTNGGITVDSNGVYVNNGNGLEFSSNALKVKPKTNGGITVDSDGVSVSAASLDNIGGVKCTVDTTNKLFKIKEGNETWVASMTKLDKPSTPSFSSPTTLTAKNSVSMTITNNATGATVYYTTDNNDPTISSPYFSGDTQSVSLAADLEGNNKGKSYTVKAIAKLNGLDSDLGSQTYTVNRKITGTPSYKVSGDQFDTSRTLTISSPSSGATAGTSIKYGTSSESINTPYSSSITVDTTTTYYAKLVKDTWEDGDSNSKTVTVGTKKMYWTILSAAPSQNLADSTIESWTEIRETSIANVSITIASGTDTADKYIVYATPSGTPQKFKVDAEGQVPFVDGSGTSSTTTYKYIYAKLAGSAAGQTFIIIT